MTEAEWEDINKIPVSKLRMMVYRAKPAVEMKHTDNLAYNIDNLIIAVNEKDARAYFVMQDQPVRKESLVLFEPLGSKGESK
jgi:hypothetical protein